MPDNDRALNRCISVIVVGVCALCCVAIAVGIIFAVQSSNSSRPRLLITPSPTPSQAVSAFSAPLLQEHQKRSEPVKRSSILEQPMATFTTNVAIIGGGAGGIASAYFATEAFHRKGLSKNQMSVTLFEGEDTLGGNVKQVQLVTPTLYDGSFGRHLMADLGSDRLPLNTLGLTRRLLAQHNVSVFYTPFKNYFNARGHTAECAAPNVKASELFASMRAELGDEYMLTPEAIGRLSMAFIDRCTYAPEFTDSQMGAAFGDVFGQSGAKPATDLLPDAYNWLLAGLRSNISAAYDWSGATDKPITHPAQSRQTCTVGVDCVSDSIRSMSETSVMHTLTGIARSLGWAPDRALNYALAWYLVANEVGSGGSWIEDTGFATFLSNQLREYGHTNDVYGFPVGGSRQLLIKMMRTAEHKGARFITNEKVLTIDRLADNNPAGKFKLVTNKRVVMVRDVLIANMVPYYLFDGAMASGHSAHMGGGWPGASMTGNLIEKLRALPEIRQPVHQEVLKVIIQFEPGVRAWFRDLFTSDGQYSVRKFGIEGESCFASMEFIDVPQKSCTNEVIVGFKCHKCQVRFEALLREAKHNPATYEALLDLAQDEIRSAWPKHASAIPRPVKVVGAIFPAGRHMGGRKYDYISNAQVTKVATQPFAETPFALVGEAYQTDYQGWIEAAFQTAQNAVQRHIGALPGMDKATGAVFHHLTNLIVEINSTSISDASRTSVFALIPPLYASAQPTITLPNKYLLKNEFWWPHTSTETFVDDQKDYCKASSYGLGPFILTV
jgi:hypothetical protein